MWDCQVSGLRVWDIVAHSACMLISDHISDGTRITGFTVRARL
jgi:hypothetical protein